MNSVQSEGVPKFSSIAECNILPEYWDDDERMNVLLNPFRNRDLNPVGYDRKLTAWKNNVDLYCKSNERCTFTIDQLKKFYTRKGKQPYCLQDVLQHMIREKEIQEMADFIKPVSQSYWLLNTSSLASSLNWIKQNYIMQTNTSDIDEDKEFVCMTALERSGKLLISCIIEDCGSDKLYRYNDLSNLIKMNICSVKLIVQWLILQKKACVMEPSSQIPGLKDIVIKFSTTNENVSPITIEMANIFVLHEKEKELTQSIEKLEKQREQITEEIKSYLKQNMRQLAKSSLKKRKETEKRIDKQIAVLDNIRSLLFSVDEAKSSGEVLNAHKSFLHLFKKYNEDVNINDVENVMEKVTDAFDTYDDIQTTLSKPIDIKTPDEADLESELENLLFDDIPNVPPSPPSGSPKRKISLDDLPKVPEDNPASPDDKIKNSQSATNVQ